MNNRKRSWVRAYEPNAEVEHVKEPLSKAIFLTLVPVVGLRQVELDEGSEVYLVGHPDLFR